MSRARDLAAFVSNADGDIKFDTDTLFIDSSANRVGIQTATPAFPLDVSTNSATTNDAVTMLRLSANSTGTAANNFGAAINFSGEDASGSLRDLSTINGIYTNATNRSSAITFKTRANLGSLTEEVRIDPDGLKFNGDTAADNALSDYEEGTFTPQYAPTGGSFASIGYASQTGTYTKIGDVVTIHILIKTSSVDLTGASGAVTITGIPFGGGGGTALGAGIGLAAQDSWLNYFPTGGWVNSAGTITLVNNDGQTTSYRTIPVANMNTTSNRNRLYITHTYKTG